MCHYFSVQRCRDIQTLMLWLVGDKLMGLLKYSNIRVAFMQHSLKLSPQSVTYFMCQITVGPTQRNHFISITIVDIDLEEGMFHRTLNTRFLVKCLFIR